MSYDESTSDAVGRQTDDYSHRSGLNGKGSNYDKVRCADYERAGCRTSEDCEEVGDQLAVNGLSKPERVPFEESRTEKTNTAITNAATNSLTNT